MSYVMKKKGLKYFHALANKKKMDLSKLKAFADDIINMTQILNFVLGIAEDIVGR